MKEYGTLFYRGDPYRKNDDTHRYDIVFEDGSYYGGLSCGAGFEFFDGNQWISTSIEMNSDGWFFPNCQGQQLDGRRVRI